MTDKSLIIVFLFSLICIYVSFMLIKGKKGKYSVIKSAVFGTVGYFFIYLFVSAGLLWFDIFSVKICSFTVMIICIIGLIVSSIKNKFSSFRNISFDKKEFIFFVLIIIVGISLTGSKFGFYGMGQDQGVYQTKAIEYIFNNNSNEYDFDYALDMLKDEEDYNYFRKAIISLQGYYFIGQKSAEYTADNTGGESGLRGIYHGIPTWPAILALFGKMFGMSHMQDCQTVFFICFLMIAFYILENFKIKTICEAASVAILATSPQIIWNSKSALTEMFLAVIIAVFIYLVCNENKDARWISWIPVAAFSFFHASVYTIMPLFVFIGWLIYISDKRIRHIISVALMILLYALGFLFMFRLSRFYTIYNYYNPMIRINRFIGEHYLYTVLITVTVSFIFTILLPLFFKNSSIKRFEKIIKEKKGLILKIISVLVLLFAVYQYVRINNSLLYNHTVNLVTISIATGIISVLLIVIGLIAVPSKRISGIQVIAIMCFFLYMVIWASFVKPIIEYCYYYGRYDVPYFLVFIIFLAVIYKDHKKTYWIPAVCVGSVIIYLNYDFVMIKTPDDTKVEWDVVEAELTKERNPDCAIILDNNHETLLEWMLILKASGENIYPYTGDLDLQTDKLLNRYNAIYYFREGIESIDISEYTQKPYNLKYNYSFEHSEDYENGTDSWNGYPGFFFSEQKELEVYSFSR